MDGEQMDHGWPGWHCGLCTLELEGERSIIKSTLASALLSTLWHVLTFNGQL